MNRIEFDLSTTKNLLYVIATYKGKTVSEAIDKYSVITNPSLIVKTRLKLEKKLK